MHCMTNIEHQIHMCMQLGYSSLFVRILHLQAASGCACEELLEVLLKQPLWRYGGSTLKMGRSVMVWMQRRWWSTLEDEKCFPDNLWFILFFGILTVEKKWNWRYSLRQKNTFIHDLKKILGTRVEAVGDKNNEKFSGKILQNSIYSIFLQKGM